MRSEKAQTIQDEVSETLYAGPNFLPLLDRLFSASSSTTMYKVEREKHTSPIRMQDDLKFRGEPIRSYRQMPRDSGYLSRRHKRTKNFITRKILPSAQNPRISLLVFARLNALTVFG